MKKGQLKHLLASALLILPLAFQAAVGVQTVSAAGEPTDGAVNVTLHKLKYTEGDKTPDITNTGSLITDLQGATPQDGATFVAYNISNYYQGVLAQVAKDASNTTSTKQQEAAQQQAETDWKNGAPSAEVSKDNPQVETDVDHTTANGGLTTFENLPLKNPDGSYATYAFIETTTPAPQGPDADTTVVKASPLIVTMPIYTQEDGKDTLNSDIHLYPKNTVYKTLDKDMTAVNGAAIKDSAVGTGGTVGTQIGDKVTYTIHNALPADFHTLKEYTLTDTADKGLNIDLGSIKVTYTDAKQVQVDVPAGNFRISPKYLASQDDASDTASKDLNGFVLDLQPGASTTDHAIPDGATVTVTYDAVITKGAEINQAIKNTVTVTPDITTTSTHNPKVGKIQFTKIDANTKAKLAGAIFVVSRVVKTDAGDETQYATQDKDTLEISKEWTTDEGAAAKFTTDKDGLIQISGLAYSADVVNPESGDYVLGQQYTDKAGDTQTATYNLVEYQAPAGYTKLAEAIPFAVVSNDGDVLLKTIQLGTDVKNSPNGILPHTGGMGIYIVIVAGLAIMAAGVFFLRRGKHHEEV
ncbi:SpaH/EbpB family LPXTG-anchored major pilin [Lacticaseibacillus kribbianus]|uniref:SpaH/EbpB family LPXTG-anchored major pilin n=1 Tax=Lacticaseibacillus kribbianus TaxID=2926292 RepID=UPI001CD69BAF|nr:SpaH/EbpB family LPXTG-anchored major pilin [Lacticaseibacillus kribbianus]